MYKDGHLSRCGATGLRLYGRMASMAERRDASDDNNLVDDAEQDDERKLMTLIMMNRRLNVSRNGNVYQTSTSVSFFTFLLR